MTPVRKTYLEFHHFNTPPNSSPVYGREDVTEVKNHELDNLVIPDTVFCFRFFDMFEATVRLDGEDIKMSSQRFNTSVMYFYGGRKLTKKEAQSEFSDDKALMNDIGLGCWENIVQTRHGSFLPLHADSILLNEKTGGRVMV
jgi:hypothetical protein